MGRCRTAMIAGAVLLLCGAAPFAFAAEPVRDPASGVGLQGLMRRLSENVTGQRVIAVAPVGDRDRDLDAAEYARAGTLLERLQVISEAQSDPTGASRGAVLIPFRVGNAYAIAPAVREAVNTDLRNLGALDAMARDALLMDAVLRVPARQYPTLGGENGMPVSALPREAQERVARAFRPPLTIEDERSDTGENDGEGPRARPTKVTRISEPIDWSRARLRANLRLREAENRDAENEVVSIFNVYPKGLVLVSEPGGPSSWSSGGTSLPVFQTVPNTYKPSDLEGRRLSQPLGLSGVSTVKDVVSQLARITGLKLRAWSLYEDRPVFVGTPEVTAGEALDALRLGLPGAWRKMGDTYLLSFDRLPVQAVQLLASESAEAAARQVRARVGEMQADPGWIALMRTLPFAEDDALALTPEQRARLFAAEAAPEEGERAKTPSVPFWDLTPSQQAYLRGEMARQEVYITGPEAVEGTRRPFTEADLAGLSLMSYGEVEVSLELPGVGWVRAPSGPSLTFTDRTIAEAARKAAGKAEPEAEEMPEELREFLKTVKPMALPSKVRGAMAPALGPARLNELADEMARHGLNTVFYPVLYGGYATFPSKAFPLHPALREQDGWAAAVAAMQPKGIRVVGYLNTLAWQNAGDNAHWLNRHPDWLDVDALGRPRLAWLDAHPEAIQPMAAFGVFAANYVRPSETAVERRLKDLVAEFAAKKEAAGIAFVEWLPLDSPEWLGPRTSLPPALGFSMPDRAAALARTGEDPADFPRHAGYLPAALQPVRRQYLRRELTETTPAQRQAADLVQRLLTDAKGRRGDWTTHLVNNTASTPGRRDAEAPKEPKADVVINTMTAAIGDSRSGRGLLFPIAHHTLWEAMGGAEDADAMPPQLLELPAIAGLAPILAESTGPAMPAIVPDFRSAPDLITPSLKWVLPPKPALSQ